MGISIFFLFDFSGEGGHSGKCLHVYHADDSGSLEEISTVSLSGAATDVVYSPDQKLCVVADSNRKVTLFNVGEEKYEKTHNKVTFICLNLSRMIILTLISILSFRNGVSTPPE